MNHWHWPAVQVQNRKYGDWKKMKNIGIHQASLQIALALWKSNLFERHKSCQKNSARIGARIFAQPWFVAHFEICMLQWICVSHTQASSGTCFLLIVLTSFPVMHISTGNDKWHTVNRPESSVQCTLSIGALHQTTQISHRNSILLAEANVQKIGRATLHSALVKRQPSCCLFRPCEHMKMLFSANLLSVLDLPSWNSRPQYHELLAPKSVRHRRSIYCTHLGSCFSTWLQGCGLFVRLFESLMNVPHWFVGRELVQHVRLIRCCTSGRTQTHTHTHTRTHARTHARTRMCVTNTCALWRTGRSETEVEWNGHCYKPMPTARGQVTHCCTYEEYESVETDDKFTAAISRAGLGLASRFLCSVQGLGIRHAAVIRKWLCKSLLHPSKWCNRLQYAERSGCLCVWLRQLSAWERSVSGPSRKCGSRSGRRDRCFNDRACTGRWDPTGLRLTENLCLFFDVCERPAWTHFYPCMCEFVWVCELICDFVLTNSYFTDVAWVCLLPNEE